MPMIRSSLRLAAALGAALFATPLSAQAESAPVTRSGVNLVFEILGHAFTLPPPDWLSGPERLSADIMNLVEHNVYADPAQAFVEFFPKGQSLRNWTTTYAARITLEPGRSLEDYRDASIAGYSQACKPEATGFFTFGEETEDFFPALGFVCGAYRDTIPELAGQGEVMVTVFLKTEAGVGVVYQEWKGPAFNPSDPATWPVTAEAFQARADQLQQHARLLVASE
jgi:hypothetical protein